MIITQMGIHLYIFYKNKEFCLNSLHVAKGPLVCELFQITKDVIFWRVIMGFSYTASHRMVLGAFGELFTEGVEEESRFKNVVSPQDANLSLEWLPIFL